MFAEYFLPGLRRYRNKRNSKIANMEQSGSQQSALVENGPQKIEFPAEIIDGISLCDICFMKFNETTKVAKVLHCGHSLCLECIVRVQEYGNSMYIECPTCRRETHCHTDKIPINFTLMESLRKMNVLSTESESPILSQSAATKNPVEQQSPKDDEDAEFEAALTTCYRDILSRTKSSLMAKMDEVRDEMQDFDSDRFASFSDMVSSHIEAAIDDVEMDFIESDGSSSSESDSDDEEDESNSTSRSDGSVEAVRASQLGQDISRQYAERDVRVPESSFNSASSEVD